MTMTDPIADMVTLSWYAELAYHDSVTMPHSKIKTHIAEILQQEGYIAGWSTEMGSGTVRLSEPLGPLTVTAWPSMVTSTPEGTVTGSRPIRDMSASPYQT